MTSEYTFKAERQDQEERERIYKEEYGDDDEYIAQPDGSYLFSEGTRKKPVKEKPRRPSMSDMVTNNLFNFELRDIRQLIKALNDKIEALENEVKELKAERNKTKSEQIAQQLQPNK